MSKNSSPKDILELSREQILVRVQSALEVKGIHLQKFLELIDSFKTEIPDEGRRFFASLKAMEHAADISKQDLLESADRQMTELARQREFFGKAISRRREEMASASKRVGELGERIDALKDELEKLQSEEERARKFAARGEALARDAMKRMDSVAAELDDELKAIKERIDHHSRYKGTAAPAPLEERMQSIMSTIDFDVVSDEQESESPATEKKVCPNCGGEMDWYDIYDKWGCYSCGHQED